MYYTREEESYRFRFSTVGGVNVLKIALSISTQVLQIYQVRHLSKCLIGSGDKRMSNGRIAAGGIRGLCFRSLICRELHTFYSYIGPVAAFLRRVNGSYVPVGGLLRMGRSACCSMTLLSGFPNRQKMRLALGSDRSFGRSSLGLRYVYGGYTKPDQ